MTAPKAYRPKEKNDSTENLGNVLQEIDQPESLHEQIDAAVFELICLSGCLETVGELMVYSDQKVHASEAGEIIKHFNGLISDGLGRMQESLMADMRRADNDSCI